MFDDLDEVLRQLLIRELPIRNGEIDIAFDQPKREWSARVNRPTLNLFLHDIRENNKLRQTQSAWEVTRHDDGSATQRRRPIRVDVHYMITAWATESEDEHRLLAHTLLALLRHPHLPEDLLPEILQDQPVPIPISIAMDDELRTPSDVWSALDNEIRPVITCVITMALNPYAAITGPLVRTRELRFNQAVEPADRQQFRQANGTSLYWSIGGTLHTEADLEDLTLTLVEQGVDVAILPEKRFVIGRLRAGEYTLEVAVKGRKPRRHKITVPVADYDLTV
jgi:hypothetical protein